MVGTTQYERRVEGTGGFINGLWVLVCFVRVKFLKMGTHSQTVGHNPPYTEALTSWANTKLNDRQIKGMLFNFIIY